MQNIEDMVKNDDGDWVIYPSLGEFNFEGSAKEIFELVKFFTSKLNFIYKDDLYQDNPFFPIFVSADGQRSSSIEDLTNNDIATIEQIIKHTQHSLLLAKLFDVLGILKNDKDYKKLAAENYWKAFNQYYTTAKRRTSIIALKRCLYLSNYTKQRQQISNIVDTLFGEYNYKNEDDKIIIQYTLSNFIAKYQKQLLKTIVMAFEKDQYFVSNFSKCATKIIEILISYYKSISDSENTERWQLEFAFVCESIAEKMRPYGYMYIQMAINQLDENKHFDLVNRLKFKCAEYQQEIFKRFNYQPIQLFDYEKVQKYTDFCKVIVKTFQQMPNGSVQLIWFLDNFKPVSKSEIDKELNVFKNAISYNLANNIVFDTDKNIVFESAKATEEQKTEFFISNIYQIHHIIKHDSICRPFWDNVKLDDSLKELIKEIVSHNLFVPSERIETVLNLIIQGFSNVREAVYVLIAQFENGCRHYLKNYKHIFTTIKQGTRQIPIDLNDILVEKEKNKKFRDSIVEVLGEDLTRELEYLNCRTLGGNLRNRNYHDGYGSTKEYKIEEMILFFMLLKAYCLGFDSNIT